MKKLAALALCMLIISAADNPENKSVTEKLTDEEISYLIEKDPGYNSVTRWVEEKRIAMQDKPALLERYKDLTIGGYMAYRKAIFDTSISNKIRRDARQAYRDNYNANMEIYKTEIDSLLAYYKNLDDEINPAYYYKVELLEITPSLVKPILSHNILEVTPLRGAIRDGYFEYSLCPYVRPGDYMREDKGCGFSFPFPVSESFIVEDECFYFYMDEYYDTPSDERKERYVFEYEVQSVNVDGRELTKYDLEKKIPFQFRSKLGIDTLTEDDYCFILTLYYDIDIPNSDEIFWKQWTAKKKEINETAYYYNSWHPK